MRSVRMELSWAAVALTLLACLATVGRLRSEERDSGVRRQALKLNDVTGMDPIRGEVKAVLADKTTASKLVAEAARMAKEKPQPFNYNATLILATVASDESLKEYESAETFYRLHMEQAKHLLSVKGLTAAYGGLIKICYANKKYAEAEKLCKEALDLKAEATNDNEDRSLDRFKSAVMEEMILSIAQSGRHGQGHRHHRSNTQELPK